MKIYLAPMEGLLDYVLRDVLSAIGGLDKCVSEFIRINDQLLPKRVFTRIVPELLNQSKTRSGVPVWPQLLGSDPICMAENAAQLASFNPAGIDINFGCPAKIVNRHGGGASMLLDPESVGQVVAAVRKAVPAQIPISAKMRLGYFDDSLAVDCAQAIANAGACELVVHGRTKIQAYTPPAYWDKIADLKNAVHIPVIANGEIWSIADARQCLKDSQCDALMLGRGMVADPGLALAIRWDLFQAEMTHSLYVANQVSQGLAFSPATGAITWHDLQPHFENFWQLVQERIETKAQTGRMKQWLNYLRRRFENANRAYELIKREKNPISVNNCLKDSLFLQ